MAFVDLFPHQRKAVQELDNGRILCGDVGTGKSLTAMAYYMEREAPKDVYVITTAKKRDSLDWDGEAAQFGISRHEGLSLAGQLHVDSWNNIDKYTEIKDAFFIFDEQRLVGTGAWVKSFYKIARANRWILLTATPGDTWLDYAPVFIANGWYKNITEFRREHVVYTYHQKFPKVDRYIGVNRLVRYRNQILVEMPYLRHTTRHVQDVLVSYDRDLFEKVVKKRWHVYEERPLRDVSELFSVMRKVVNSDESRMTEVRRLLERHPKLIVFYNFDYELEQLRTLAEDPSTRRSDEWLSDTTPCSGILCEGTSGSEQSSERPHRSTIDSNKGPHPSTIEASEGRSATSTPLLIGSESRGSASTDEPTTQAMSKSSFAMAEWNGHKHEQIPQTDSWVYLVQYRAGAEGWNCTDTDAMVFYSMTYSYRDFHQSQGRIDRLNTPFKDLHYYVLASKSMIDVAIRKSLRGKRDFNESAFLGNTREY